MHSYLFKSPVLRYLLPPVKADAITDDDVPEHRLGVRLALASNRLYCHLYHSVTTLTPPPL